MKKWNAKGFAERNNIPYQIDLKTRRGVTETKLILVGVCCDEVNYKIQAQYPYSLHGEPDKYAAIDFSEGPYLTPGYMVQHEEFDTLILKEIAETDNDILMVFSKSDQSMFV